jgi:hypothetical protein
MRRSAVEPVIGHLKDEHRMGRNYLAHRHGDLNRHPRRRRLQLPTPHQVAQILWCRFLMALFPKPKLSAAENVFFTGD